MRKHADSSSRYFSASVSLYKNYSLRESKGRQRLFQPQGSSKGVSEVWHQADPTVNRVGKGLGVYSFGKASHFLEPPQGKRKYQMGYVSHC